MWGERQALQALKLVEAVRNGADAHGVAESLMTELTDSVAFWQSERKAADEFSKRRRDQIAARAATEPQLSDPETAD